MDNKLRQNMLLNVSYNILAVIVPFITAPYLGRVLGAERVGIYTYVNSIAAYFSCFAMLGLMNYGSREIAKVRDDEAQRNKVFSKIYSMQFFTCTIVFIAYLFFAALSDQAYKPYFFIMSLWVLANIFDVGWFCSGMEQFKAIVIMGLISKILNITLIFCFVHTIHDLSNYVLLAAFGQLVSHIFIWMVVKKQTSFTMYGIQGFKECIKPNIMLFIPVIAASIYNIMDKLMIGTISSNVDLAYYEYADKLVQIPTLVFSSIGTVMLSRMSNLSNKDPNQGEHLIGLSMDLSMVISSAATFGLAAISEELVVIYYGEAFQPSAKILLFLSPVVFFYAWSNVLRMQYIIPQGRDYVYIKATIAGAVVNLIMNALFIPRFGALGATFGTLAAQATVALVFTFYCSGYLPLRKYILTNVPCVLIGIIMFGCIKTLQLMHGISFLGLVFDFVVGAIVFTILIITYGMVSSTHLASLIISNILKKGKE